MSYQFYITLHALGIMMLFLGLGGVLGHVLNGGDKTTNQHRKLIAITHGLGLFILLVSGFGLLARLGIHWPWPGWLTAKLIVWLLLGGALALAYRMTEKAKLVWWLVLFLGLCNAIFALHKPF